MFEKTQQLIQAKLNALKDCDLWSYEMEMIAEIEDLMASYKVLANGEPVLQKLRDEMQGNYDDTIKEYIDYVLQRSEVCSDQKIKTKRDARNYLQDIDIDWEYESTMREAGYLSGYNDGICLVDRILSSSKTKGE